MQEISIGVSGNVSGSISNSVGASIALLILIALTIGYWRGWAQLRRAMPTLATRARLLAFLIALTALTLALVWPLPNASNALFTMRSLQNVLLCMVAAPMLWLSAPVHTLVWGQRRWARRTFTHLRTAKWSRATIQRLSQPLIAWFVYTTAFLFWHDPTYAQFILGNSVAHTIAPWLLFGAALLLWWPVVNAGPRFQRNFPAWLLIVYLIILEILNMVAGMSIAFSVEPLYSHYTVVRGQFAPNALPWGQITDQIMGGAIVWIFGSLVYISSIVFVLLDLFRKDGSTTPQPLPNWDDNGKFIAPGLEHRVTQNKFRDADLKHR